jgi:NTE family protein
MLYASARSYLDAKARPYLHLVDGGLTDNLGVRGMLDRTIASGSLDASFRGVPPHSLRELVLISVNSERDTAERIDQSDKVPSTSQVLDALVFGAGSRATQETLAVMRDDAKRWAKELATLRGRPGSPFAPDAQLHVISVSLRDLQDPDLRQRLLHVPTAFTILPVQVRKLREAGREVLRESKEFQGLRESLGLPGAAQE